MKNITFDLWLGSMGIRVKDGNAWLKKRGRKFMFRMDASEFEKLLDRAFENEVQGWSDELTQETMDNLAAANERLRKLINKAFVAGYAEGVEGWDTAEDAWARFQAQHED